MSSHSKLVNSITVYSHQLDLEANQLVLNLTVHFARVVELCPIIVSKRSLIQDAKNMFTEKYKVDAKVVIYNNRFQNSIWKDDISIQSILDAESKNENSFHVFLKKSDTISYEYKEELIKEASKLAEEKANKAKYKEMRHKAQMLDKNKNNAKSKPASSTPVPHTEPNKNNATNQPVSASASMNSPLTPTQSEFNFSAIMPSYSSSVFTPSMAPNTADFSFINPEIINNNPRLAVPLSAPELNQQGSSKLPCGWILPVNPGFR